MANPDNLDIDNLPDYTPSADTAESTDKVGVWGSAGLVMVEIGNLPGTSAGGSGVEIGETPPENTEILWLDTSE